MRSTKRVTIICRRLGHGPFMQTPSHHLMGGGCPECARSLATGRWNPATLSPERAVMPGVLYYVRFMGGRGETFYKIGVTDDIHRRLYVFGQTGWTVDEVRTWRGTFRDCSWIERLIIGAYRRTDGFRPTVLRSNGATECFRRDVLELDGPLPTRRRRAAPPAPDQLMLFAPASIDNEVAAHRETYRAAGATIGFDRAIVDALLDRALAAGAYRWLGFPRSAPPLRPIREPSQQEGRRSAATARIGPQPSLPPPSSP